VAALICTKTRKGYFKLLKKTNQGIFPSLMRKTLCQMIISKTPLLSFSRTRMAPWKKEKVTKKSAIRSENRVEVLDLLLKDLKENHLSA
jgi:hypothetical protein